MTAIASLARRRNSEEAAWLGDKLTSDASTRRGAFRARPRTYADASHPALRLVARSARKRAGSEPTLLRTEDFEKLLRFRVELRRFQRWSEDQAQAAGLTHVQHQLLVAVKGHPGGKPPAVGDVAGYLLLKPHSTVELIDRAEAAGLVTRSADPDDGRVVRVRLTARGERAVRKLTHAHLARLHDLAAVLDELVAGPDRGTDRRQPG